KLVEGSIAFKENRVLEGVFHYDLIGLAEKAGVSPGRYANIVKFTEYMITFESIEIAGLYREFEDYEARIREKLYRNGEERELHGTTQIVRLLKQLYGMNIDSREYACITGSKNSINAARCAAFIKDKCLKYGVPVTGGYDLGRIFGEVDEALKFYRDAEKRNSVMLANTVKRMRKEGKQVAALITGGFHTDGLAKLMREKKLSYFVIVPSFEEGKERPYVTILTGRKKPYKALLEAGRYQLAMELCFQSRESVQETFDELILPMLFRGIAGTLYQDERVEPFLEDWTHRYGLVEAQHRAKKPSEDSAGKVPAEKIRAFLKSGGIVWHVIKDKVIIRYTDIEGAGEAHYVIVTSDFRIDPNVPDSMKRLFVGRMKEAPSSVVERKRDPGLSDKTPGGLNVDEGLTAKLVNRFAGTSPKKITSEEMKTMLRRLNAKVPVDLEGLVAVVKSRLQAVEGMAAAPVPAPEPSAEISDSAAKRQPPRTNKKDIGGDRGKTPPSSSPDGKIVGILLAIAGITALLDKLGIINAGGFVADNAAVIEAGGGILMAILVVSILFTSFLTSCTPQTKEESRETPAATSVMELSETSEGVVADGGDVKVERDERVAIANLPRATMTRADGPADKGRILGIGLTPTTEEKGTVTGYQREEGSSVWWVKINVPKGRYSQNRFGDVLFDLGDSEYNPGDKLTLRVGLAPEFGNNNLKVGLVEVDGRGKIERWIITSNGWTSGLSRSETEWGGYSFQIPEGYDLSKLRVIVSFEVYNTPIDGKDALGVWFQLHEEPEAPEGAEEPKETPVATATAEPGKTGEAVVEGVVGAAGDDMERYIGRNLVSEQTGWIPETQFDSRGCYSVERTPEGYLKVNFNIRRNDPDNETSKGEVRFEFPYSQVIDLEGHRVAIEFEIEGFGAETSSPNGVQVFTKSGDTWEGRYGSWVNVPGDGSMTAHDIVEGPETHSAAWISPDFNPTRIKAVGLKLGTSDNPSLSRTRFKGSVIIKSLTIERVGAAESAGEAPRLQSVGNYLLPEAERSNVPAVSPEDFRKNFGVSFHNYFGNYGYTFGSGGGPLDERYLREAFESLVEEGFYVVRNFLLSDLRSGVQFDGNGKPVGYNDWLVDDIANYVLAGYEAGCTRLFLDVNDFHVANGTNSSDRAVPVGTITDGEYPNLFTNMADREAYFDLIRDVLDKVYRRLDAAGVPRDFAVWGVLNEPEGVNLGVPNAFNYVQDFVRRGLKVFKELGLPIVLNSQHIEGLKYWVPLFDAGYQGEQHYHVHWYGQHGEAALKDISAERLNIPPHVKIWVGEGDPNFLLALLETAFEGKIEGVLVWNDGGYVMLPVMRYGDPYDAKRAATSRERQEEARTWFADKQEKGVESDSQEESPEAEGATREESPEAERATKETFPDEAVEVSKEIRIFPEEMGPNPGDSQEVYLDLRGFSLPEDIPVGAENAVDLRGYKVEFVFEGMKSEDMGKFQPYVKDKAWRTRFLSRGVLYSDGTAVYTVEEGAGFDLEAIFALGYRFFRVDFDTAKEKLREIRIVPVTDEGA
ncbi:MAG: hypothetical protein ABIH74_05175, partial [Candidatus Omnitrophota bacterium]